MQQKRRGRMFPVAMLALFFALLQAHVAAAAIVNTVTAAGTGEDGKPVTATATATVDVIKAAPLLTLEKSGTVNLGGDGVLNPGDVISYSFKITNTGNITLTNLTVSDPKVTVSGGPLASLAPGASDATTFTASYTLTQADIDAGHVANTATATGSDPGGNPVTGSGNTTTELGATSSGLTLVKSGTVNLGSDGIATAGETVTYRFVVKNTGTTTLTNIKITDPRLNLARAEDMKTRLALAETEDVLAEPADPMPTGSIDEAGSPVKAAPGPAQQNSLAVSRQAYLLPAQEGGPARVEFIYAVTNTGDMPLTGVQVSKPSALALGDRIPLLAPGETDHTTFVFVRDLAAGEAAQGELAEDGQVTARARGGNLRLPAGQPVRTAQLVPAADLETASIAPLVIKRLAAGKQAVLTATYVLTQADIDAGKIDNTATASGTDPSGNTVSNTASTTVDVIETPGIAVLKAGTLNVTAGQATKVGDTITYAFTVQNTGNVTLTNVTVTDPKVTVQGGPIASLAPGAVDTTTFTATYALTQADLDAGAVTNQATATGAAPGGGSVSDLSGSSSLTTDDPTVTKVTADPKIALVKAVGVVSDTNGDGKTNAGDTLTFKLTVTNTGNVTLTNVTVTDPNATVTGGPLASLAPGQSDAVTFVATHVLTQADVDAGKVTNQATASGTDPEGNTIEDPSDNSTVTGNTPTETEVQQLPAIALVKRVANIVDVNKNGLNDTGDIINYAFEVTNTGNVTLTGIVVTDPLVQVSGGPLASLAPGFVDKTTFTAQYTITANDLSVGQVVNQATATGTAPKGGSVSDPSDNASIDGNNPTVTALEAKPAIGLLKQTAALRDVDGNGVIGAGDQIDYKFTVQNMGNVKLTGITVTDPLVTVIGGPLASLEPGEADTTTFTATYTITPADVLVGKVVNQAKAAGTSPSGQTVSDESDGASLSTDGPTITILNATPAIALIKTSTVEDKNGNGFTDAGDVIHYAFAVKNTGNVDLTNVTITDPKVTVTGGPIATLAVGAEDTTTFTAAYTITAADVDAGSVTNQATATGNGPEGPVTDDSDNSSYETNNPTITTITSHPGIALVKTVGSITDVNGDGVTDAGDVIHYRFAVTNTGNVTIHDVSVTDPKVTVKGGPLATLASGATDNTTFTADYTVTYDDAVEGEVVNQATVSGTLPNGAEVTDISDDDSISGNDPTVTPVVKNKPGLTKTALVSKVHRGDRVPFEITATAVAFSPVRIIDIMPPGFTYLTGSATVNGTAVTPTVRGRYVTFTGLKPNAKGNIKIKLTLIAGAAAPTGTVVNNAEIYDDLSQTPVAKAKASVELVEDAVFDCGEIIGRVFDDKNNNGYADDGEPGIPAVRIATVNGLLVTTDKDGRFHVACAAIPDAQIGSNFVMKLDTRTLPAGYTLTTENPRDVRLTRGKVTKLNFGVSHLRLVKLTLRDAAFVPGKAVLQAKFAGGIDKLIKTLEAAPSSLQLTYQTGTESKALAGQRLEAVRAAIESEWAKRNEPFALSIDSRITGVK